MMFTGYSLELFCGLCPKNYSKWTFLCFFGQDFPLSGPIILKSKGMHVIFQKKRDKERAKKCLKRAKKGKIFENLCKNVQNLKMF